MDRFAVINQVLEGGSTQALAAQQLGLSARQVKRLCLAVEAEGAAALVSKRQGRQL